MIVWRESQEQADLRKASDLDDIDDPRIKNRCHFYKIAEDYYDGEHKTKLLDRAKIILESNGIPFSENFCDIIVDVMGDRMKIESFTVTGDESDAIGKQISAVRHRNSADEEEGVAHTQTFIKGDGFIIVSASEEGAIFQFNRPDGIKCVYNSENPRIIDYAVKVWNQNEYSEMNPHGDNISRMNIYYEDRVEKYFRIHEGGDWIVWWDDTDEYWPIPWTENMKPDGIPLGVPVFHISNKPKGRKYGRSEIRKAIPMQDAYNKALLDVFEIMDTQGFPQRWGTGVGKEQASNLKQTPGSVWAVKNTDARFGQFDAADLDKIGRMIERKLRNVAALTQTPVHMMFFNSGDTPSGETIRAAEAGLVSKVRDRQSGFGMTWAGVMRMCLKLDNILIGGPSIVDENLITVNWRNPETASLVDLLDAALKKQVLGVSKETILKELGYEDPKQELSKSEEEASRIMERNLAITQAGGLPQVQYQKQ